MTRRKFLLVVWALAIIGSGFFVGDALQSMELGLGMGMSLALLAVSLGVPLLRAFTEFSK